MKSTNKAFQFLTSKGVFVAFFAVLFYGLLMISIYFYGYDPMPKKVNQMPVAIVNQDNQATKLVDQLESKLPFQKIHHLDSLVSAKKELNNRQVYLIVKIPSNFTKRIGTNQSTKLSFYINQSNQTFVTSSMEAAAKAIGATVNANVMTKKGQAILTDTALKSLNQQLAAQIKQNPQAKAQIAALATEKQGQIKQTVSKTYQNMDQSVATSIHKTNPIHKGLNYTLMPFFLSLAIYIGSMIGTMILYGTYTKYTKLIGRFKAFLMLEISMLLISIIAPLIVVVADQWLGALAFNKLPMLWLIHGVELFAGFNFNAVFVLLLGQAGTVVNLPLVFLQVVASAGMVPHEIQSGFFRAIGNISPVYYAFTNDLNSMFGGQSTTNTWLLQAGLIVTLIIINTLVVSFRKQTPTLEFSRLA